MKQKRYSGEQISFALRRVENGTNVEEEACLELEGSKNLAVLAGL